MTNEVKRMSGIKFTPSTAQQDVRWAAAVSKKQAMLRSSDWTQLRDVHSLLTPEQRLAWDGWRRRVRSTKTADHETPELFEAALQALSARLPADIIQPDVTAPAADLDATAPTAPLPSLHEGTSINAEDAVWEITRLALESVARKCRVLNPALFSAQCDEAAECKAFMIMNDYKAIDPARYPVLNILATVGECTIDAVADQLLERRKHWLIATSYIQAVAEKALIEIDPSDQASEHNRKLIMELDADIQAHIHQVELPVGY